MTRPTFLMLVGLPASGKSTISQKLAKEYNAIIFSSDKLREEMFGDVNDQEHNQELFVELHKRIKDFLRNGKSAIYDACNVSYKRRIAFLAELKSIECKKICVVMATPYEECLQRNANRDRKVPEHVIKRMYYSFDIPWYYEGWDQIEVEYAPGSENSFGWAFDWVESVMDYNQDNPHHSSTLGRHCEKARKWIDNNKGSTQLRYAALIHDCGKPKTKTFVNSKGETTDIAHYYNHERTGSYDSLFYEMATYNVYVSVIIRWHMQPYFWEKDNNEKLHNKYKNLWGEDLYRDIMMLHEADKNSH